MKIVAIAGASGVVGRYALQYLLARNEVDRVISLGRRTLPVQHEKLVSKVIDPSNKAALAAGIPVGISAALCCLGTTMKKAGSKAAFRAVDHDAVIAFAEAALERGAQRFILVSSIGADPRSRNFYLRTKGETEQDLAKLGFSQLAILRPSFIDDQGTRDEYRPAERLALPFARLFFSIVARNSRYAPIAADTIAKAMIRLALVDTAERVQVLEGKTLHDAGQ